MRELAAREGVDNSYVNRMINLTLLPTGTVKAILDDTMPDNTVLFDLAVEPPVVWVSRNGVSAKNAYVFIYRYRPKCICI